MESDNQRSLTQMSSAQHFSNTKIFSGLIYREFTLRATYRYIDFLPKLVHRYNHEMVHSKIKMTPIEATKKKHEKMLLETVYKIDRPRTLPKFKMNQAVRLAVPQNVFSKSYWNTFSPQIYYIHAINSKWPNVYKVRDHEGKVLPESWYQEQLTAVKRDDIYLVESVLQKKNKKILVKWWGYPKPTWEDEGNFVSDVE